MWASIRSSILLVFCAVVGAATASSAWANIAATAAPEMTALQGARPTAFSRLRVWGFDVYDARLWTLPGFGAARFEQQPFALELKYLRKLDGAAIASRSIEEMRRVGVFSEIQEKSWHQAMRQLFPNVDAHDRITGLNWPGKGVEFWLNGQRLGWVQDPAFARLFFGIWLDERTSEPKMRLQLLQGLAP
jgi:hypothetical protein